MEAVSALYNYGTKIVFKKNISYETKSAIFMITLILFDKLSE